jgi:hypothetical protein
MKKTAAILLISTSCYGSPTLTILGGGNFAASKMDFGGVSVMAGDSGGTGGAQLMAPVAAWASVGFDYLYSDLGEKNDGSFIAPFAGIDYHLKAQTFLAMARLEAPSSEEKVHGFVFGGLGVHRTSATGHITPLAGYVWADTNTSESRELLNDSTTNLAAALGLGMDVDITKAISVGVEGRWQYLKDAKFETSPISSLLPTTTTLQGDIQDFVLLFRACYRFGPAGN